MGAQYNKMCTNASFQVKLGLLHFQRLPVTFLCDIKNKLVLEGAWEPLGSTRKGNTVKTQEVLHWRFSALVP